MKPSIAAYTVALPWYEREDYLRLWELAHDRHEMPGDYDAWHEAALRVINGWLARGRALQIVTIRPDEFLEWLEAHSLPNTAATRRKFVEERASSAGSETNGIDVAASPRST